ncbi:hypothetical protein BDA99DRAFT_538765 [Phascolomyces articulosus]|uniref:Uncharacterized protein n=1 Tax=Phascolomyces articulosus TaxID=60185 RepID=A0AAD5JXE5_9FUNG|nr:hypothetical protein BDA99DRAFT_538765 [Phascolomyces articulosus]
MLTISHQVLEFFLNYWLCVLASSVYGLNFECGYVWDDRICQNLENYKIFQNFILPSNRLIARMMEHEVKHTHSEDTDVKSTYGKKELKALGSLQHLEYLGIYDYKKEPGQGFDKP